MTVGRVTTLTVEVLRRGDPAGRVTTLTTEVLRRGDPAGRVTTLTVEALVRYVTPVTSDHAIPREWVYGVISDLGQAGSGESIESPIILTTGEELLNMDVTKHYALGNDLDINAYDWTPLGAASTPFTGSIDGRGFRIFNLHSTYNADACGLIWQIADTAVIRRLGVATTAAGITGQVSGEYTGVLVGHGNVTSGWLIEDCWVEGKLDTGGDRCGGLIGITASGQTPDSDLRRNRAAVELSGTIGSRVGGITGWLSSTGLTHSDNYFDSDVATTTNLGTGGVGTFKTTTQMRAEATFNNFNFSGVWNIDEGVDYPYLDEIPPSVGILIDWELEVAGGIEADQLMLIEWTQGLALDNEIPVEWTLELLLDHEIPVDWITEMVPADHAIPVEWITVIVPADHVIPIAWLQGLAADHQIPYGWDQPSLLVDHIINVEWHLELLLDHEIPVAWINEIVPADYIIPIGWLQGIASDNAIPIEWGGQFSADNSIPINWSGIIIPDQQIPVEWSTAITEDHQIPADWRSGLFQNHQIPVNWSGVTESDHVIPYAFRGPFTGADSLILIEWHAELELDHTIPVEWTLDVIGDHQIPIDWLLETVVFKDHVIPIDWKGPVDSDHVIPYYWLTIVFLELDQPMPIEWALTLELDHTIPVEWTVGLFRDHGIPIDWHLELLLDGLIPFDWSLPFSGVDFAMPIEWLTELQPDHAAPIEWLGPLKDCDEVTAPYDAFSSQHPIVGFRLGFQLLGAGAGSWVGVASFSGYTVAMGDVIDSAIYAPFSNTGVPASGDVDVQIHAELAVDPPVASSSHLPFGISPLTTASVNYFRAVSSPPGAQGTVDLKPVMDELKAIGALASPAFNINLVFVDRASFAAMFHHDATLSIASECKPADYGIPIEWVLDAGGLATIPIEWSAPFSGADLEIPIEWVSGLSLDFQIPYSWLTETTIAISYPMPIEWQQIFFKKFDQIIPWEAQGISDTVHFIPIEWGGDPGGIAAIPVEWIDPTFALFVSHLEDCNFWVARCDPTEWAAACWGADWVAEPLSVVEYSEPSGLDWDALDEELGGTWISDLRKAGWAAACDETLWPADPSPRVWLAEQCDTGWGTQTQSTVWNATPQGTRWTVLEPNVRGDR